MIPGWWQLIAGLGLVAGIVTVCKSPQVRFIDTVISVGEAFTA